MNLQPWPYVKCENQWSIPNEILFFIWDELVNNGNDKELFYDAGIKNGNEFISYMQNPSNFLVLGVDSNENKIVAFGFVNNYQDGHAYAHFSFMDGFRKNVGEMIIDYWRQLKRPNGDKIFEILIGITPESYEKVIKIIQTWGFQIIGKIPKICFIADKGIKEAGIISYLEL
jgi:hypothetical protein